MTTKIILLASASLIAAPVFAQTAPQAAPQAAPAADRGLADIIVTATKRETNLQSVPVAVTALGSAALANQRIAAFGDLTRAAASLTITQGTASPNNSIILRGIGTFAFSIGVEPSVAVIVDDVPVVQQAQAFDNLNDVERIEVLRGPQGTLFGKNASAGAINIVTKDPGKSTEFAGEVTATTDSQFGGNASISTPLSKDVGLRVSGYYSHFDGFIHNLANGHLLGDESKYGVRAKVKAKLSSRLTAMLTANYSEFNQNGTAGAYGTVRYLNLNYVPPGAAAAVVPKFAGVSILPALVGITQGVDNYNVSIDNDSPTSNSQATFSGKLTYDLGFANLISVTSYQDWKYNFTSDVDMTALNVVGAAAPVTSPVGPATSANQSGPYHSTEFTQELRLISKGGAPLTYVAGLFYANAASNRSFTRGPVVSPAQWTGYQGTRSLAAFANVDYKLPTKTTLSGAIRVNNERIQDNFVDSLPSHNANPTIIAADCGIGAANCAGRNLDTAVTFKASVSQELAPRVLGYASVATGYKGYAFDISSGYGPLRTANPVLPERSVSYEVGIKSRFLENRVQLNVSGFYTDYNNFQAQSSQLINGALQQKLNNVGKLRTKGFEVELLTKPTNWLHIDGSAAYTDATVVSFPGAACYPGQAADQALAGLAAGPSGSNFCGNYTVPGGTNVIQAQDRSGSQLPNSPKFKFNIGATIDQNLSHDTKGTLTINYQHQSGVNYDLLGDPLLTQGGYGIVNGAIGVEHGAFKVSVFVNNLFDQHYVTGVSDQFGNYGTHAVLQYQSRDSLRYFGVKAGVHF
jgi:iron complex outermembrane receptor protein